MNYKILQKISILIWITFLLIFLFILKYFNILIFYDGVLTVLKAGSEEEHIVFIPSQSFNWTKKEKKVTLKYFDQKRWWQLNVYLKWQIKYFLILNQEELELQFWHYPAKIYVGQQSTLQYLLKNIV